jgi:hypothetical protein
MHLQKLRPRVAGETSLRTPRGRPPSRLSHCIEGSGNQYGTMERQQGPLGPPQVPDHLSLTK